VDLRGIWMLWIKPHHVAAYPVDWGGRLVFRKFDVILKSLNYEEAENH
jgi:hypothetical protein